MYKRFISQTTSLSEYEFQLFTAISLLSKQELEITIVYETWMRERDREREGGGGGGGRQHSTENMTMEAATSMIEFGINIFYSSHDMIKGRAEQQATCMFSTLHCVCTV